MDFRSLAERWLELDPDPESQNELRALLDDPEALAERFAGRLSFGTAGLRGPRRAGPNGMNALVVMQSALGLARYLKKNFVNPSVVIGYDARAQGQDFARRSAAVLQGAGVETHLLPRALPTPVLAYVHRALNSTAAIMVTASHNPPGDQGYKVYLGGAQIIAPSDKAIAAEIDAVAAEAAPFVLSDAYQPVAESHITAYVHRVAQLITAPPAPLNYVYTALHGVGTATLLAALGQAGLNPPTLVRAQCDPDPTFPTVAFPNPEEAGALDLAQATAAEVGADLIIANDPDADRLAVALPGPGGWQRLSGNQIGLLLGWAAARSGKKGVLATTLVSSPLLAEVAKRFGLGYRETLTGFKYLGRVDRLLFAYEEALGYLVNPQMVHDKDGIAAALALLNLQLELRAEGKTLADHWQEFVATFGASASGQVAKRFPSLAEAQAAMQQVRAAPPTEIAGRPVLAVKDYRDDPHWASDILRLDLDGARLLYRPSGTEAKLKIYLDVSGPDEAHCAEYLRELEAAL